MSVFEWGTVKKFSGILKLEPYPHLLVPRPGATGTQYNFSTYYLVAPFKFGLDREKLSALDGKTVSLQGTLIYRGNQTMVEALPDSIKAADKQLPPLPGVETIQPGPADAHGRDRGQQMLSRRDESRPASAASRLRHPLHQRRHSTRAARARKKTARPFICCLFPPTASRSTNRCSIWSLNRCKSPAKSSGKANS